MYKVGFITLGCKVNIYESNALEQELINNGFSIVEPSKYCDIFVINTCSVTNTADQKSRQMVSKARRLNKDAIVCVLGCYVQTSGLKANELDADIILGNGNKLELIPLLKQRIAEKQEKYVSVIDIMKKRDYENLEVTTYDHARAFVKIEDGCNQFCAYCIIPYARGPIRSKKASDVIQELKRICSMGFNEVVLAGIHTGKYNDNGIKLSDLIEQILIEVPELKRLRLSSIEINEIDEKLLQLMEKSNVLANHLHLPLQTGNNKILSLMNRPYDTETFLKKVKEIRKVRPDIAITTDVIVGFPYETEEDFLATKEFIKEVNFAGLHVFPYSKRNGTKASTMPQINGIIKKMRAKELIELSNELEDNYYKSFVGKEVEVIFEQRDNMGLLEGHSSNYILVHVDANDDLIRKNARVTLLEYKDGMMFGKIVE